jgi:hypothetical protein
MNKPKIFEAGGYLGIGLIQGSTLPSLVGVAAGWSTDLPPLSMVLMVWVGLALFLARSIYNRQTLYIVSEGVGIVLQSILLAIIVFPS